MIHSDEAMDLLIEACPSYWRATDLEAFVSSFEEPDTPDLFVRIGAFAHHLVNLVGANELDEPTRVFDAVELVLDDGDEDAVELMHMGLIEALQNITSHDDVLVAPERVEALLGPRAHEAWLEIDALWQEASRTLDDWPRVTDADYRNIVDPNLRRYLQAGKRRLPDGTLMSVSDVVAHQTSESREHRRIRSTARWWRHPVMVALVALGLLIGVALVVFG